MSIETMRDKTQKQLDSLRAKLSIARGKADLANQKVAELERQEAALQSALDALNGKQQAVRTGPIAVGQEFPRTPHLIPSPSFLTNAPIFPQNGNVQVVNGVAMLIEPGMKVIKNSFGEDCIVPESHPGFAQAQEPIKPVGTFDPMLGEALPAPARPIAGGSSQPFDRPEDLI